LADGRLQAVSCFQIKRRDGGLQRQHLRVRLPLLLLLLRHGRCRHSNIFWQHWRDWRRRQQRLLGYCCVRLRLRRVQVLMCLLRVLHMGVMMMMRERCCCCRCASKCVDACWVTCGRCCRRRRRYCNVVVMLLVVMLMLRRCQHHVLVLLHGRRLVVHHACCSHVRHAHAAVHLHAHAHIVCGTNNSVVDACLVTHTHHAQACTAPGGGLHTSACQHGSPSLRTTAH
jgi:hypothetical protein